jgi:hypothetical protein
MESQEIIKMMGIHLSNMIIDHLRATPPATHSTVNFGKKIGQNMSVWLNKMVLAQHFCTGYLGKWHSKAYITAAVDWLRCLHWSRDWSRWVAITSVLLWCCFSFMGEAVKK